MKRVKKPGLLSKLRKGFTGKSGVGNAKKKGMGKTKSGAPSSKRSMSEKVGKATADQLLGKNASRVTAKKRSPSKKPQFLNHTQKGLK